MEFRYGYLNFHHLQRPSSSLKLDEIGGFQILSLHIRTGLKIRVCTNNKTN
jgi:hypothetical protein